MRQKHGRSFEVIIGVGGEDLSFGFWLARRRALTVGSFSRDAYADRFTQINIVYHGTQRQHVGSIVRSGFVPPGTKTTDGVKVNLNHGSPFSLGDGIYASAEVIHSIG